MGHNTVTGCIVCRSVVDLFLSKKLIIRSSQQKKQIIVRGDFNMLTGRAYTAWFYYHEMMKIFCLCRFKSYDVDEF